MKKKQRKLSRGKLQHHPETSETELKMSTDNDSFIVGTSPYKIPNYLKDSNHPFEKFKSTTCKQPPPGKYSWMDGDNIKNFKQNKRNVSKDWKYLKKEITYTLNSDGYRTYEWDQIDWKKSIVLIGCSCTFGIGVSDDETIAHHLEKLSGRQVINLGIPGGSNSLILQNAVNILENFTAPYAVAHLWSTPNRFKFLGETKGYNVGPWDGTNTTRSQVSDIVDINHFWRLTYADPYHELGLAYYNGKIGKYLWAGKSKYSSISFFPDTAYYTNSEKHFVIDNGARDLMHPGEESFKNVAKYLHERFK